MFTTSLCPYLLADDCEDDEDDEDAGDNGDDDHGNDDDGDYNDDKCGTQRHATSAQPRIKAVRIGIIPTRNER